MQKRRPAKNTLDAVVHTKRNECVLTAEESLHQPLLFPSVPVWGCSLAYRFLTPVNIREEMTSAYTRGEPEKTLDFGLDRRWRRSIALPYGVPLIIAFNRSGQGNISRAHSLSWLTDHNHLYRKGGNGCRKQHSQLSEGWLYGKWTTISVMKIEIGIIFSLTEVWDWVEVFKELVY